ncbi:hypothetical protein C1893_15110 [Pseudomonas sp. MPR-ANC1]|uniref:hypothetical protein n=1 Tax=Pseudomonas sp. MPR-ANC1 TaxID=2075548 RepID=UPI000CD065B4|nr:hypothetical protein [Pseudomonas sp. MPR-ANC1]POA47506.1 hypothetical protein C1893_15110 [Pseudomonas sp. MPR-ANC1]
MSYFNRDFFTSSDTNPPLITVSARTYLTISNRVEFDTQDIHYEAHPDPANNLIGLHSFANFSHPLARTHKYLKLYFDKTIESGSYSVSDPDFPFDLFHYVELGTKGDGSAGILYEPTTGTVTVEVIEVSPEKLHYQINYDFKASGNFNEDLTISGESTFIVMLRKTY